MTQNHNANNSAPGVEPGNNRMARTYPRPLTGLAAFLIAVSLLEGQATNVQVGTTATQAVMTYTAPDNNSCSVEIHEGAVTGPLVHDVDPSLFSGSQLDSRSVNLTKGQRRIFVAGKRTAETALDGLRYSRALQTDTLHTYKITCGSNSIQGQFTTMNAPLGASLNDPLPVDPQQPGQYAWPDFNFSARNQAVIDPLTGFRLKLFDSPRDSYQNVGSGAFVAASNVGGGTDWLTPNGVLADDSASATYSGATRGWLFVDAGLAFQNSAVHSALTNSMNTFVPTFKAFCSSSDCATASNDDRSIQYCLTIDGTTCASDLLEMVLTACTTNCGTTGQAAFSNPQTLLADWFVSNHGSATFDSTDFSRRTGNVSRNGAQVTLVNGDRFNLKWKADTPILINGTAYTITSVDNDQALTLSGGPTGSDSGVPYVASNAGLLIRKKTASTHQISIQNISYVYESGSYPLLESGGDEDSYANCSPIEVTGPGGEKGWHCSVSAGAYWVGKDTGTVNRLGRTVPAYNPAPDGWNQQPCAGGSYWDWQDPNSFYCPTNNNQGHVYILKFTYTGNNSDIGDLEFTQAVVPCTGSNAPCWTITNLTPGTSALDLQMAAFHPDWVTSHFRTNSISLFGRMGSSNSLLLMARRDQINDTMAFLFRFNLTSGKIEGALPTWRKFPLRWSAMHGPFNINDPSWVQVSATYFRGPSSGRDIVAGNGPYYSTITTPGGIDGVNHSCPARPSDSPIPVSEWPQGAQCITLTVDGEPGDPTPFSYSSGTVSVTGTNGTTVVGSNAYWNSSMDGAQMVINNNSYTFTFVASNQGTLDRSPGTVTDAPYVLQVEPINNPKVGNPAFGYLQNAEVRDIFCATNKVDCQYNYPANEFMRLILKNGNTWTLQRGYSGGLPQREMKALNEGAWLIATPSSCYFGTIYPCPDSRIAWNVIDDPYGYNANGNTVVIDPKEKGCCHGTRQNNLNLNLGLACPHNDIANSGCYFTRFNGLPASLTDDGYYVSTNPLFHQLAGLGTPNPVDSHPSHNQSPPAATPNDMRWMADARPFLGNDRTPVLGTLVSGSLYKFDTSAQGLNLHRRTLPTLASCGAQPLLDISGPVGPASSITDGAADNYKYCVALANGECVSNSTAGDLYVNCPQIRLPYCSFPGIGSADTEARDICFADMGAHMLNAAQVGVDRPDPDGVNSRRVTAGMGRYKWINQFWNVKVLPNGRWLFVWSVFHQGLRNSVLLAKLPMFPPQDGINRGDYLTHAVTVVKPTVPGVTNAVVQFWYDKTVTSGQTIYHCYARNEACVQGAAADFAYQSENPTGMPCANGCVIPVQAISQRVLYYQVLLRDANNAILDRLDPVAFPMK